MDEHEIGRVFSQGRAEWPEVALEYSVFRQHLARVLGDEPDWDWTRSGAELYLICACLQGDVAALRAFEAHTEIATAITRIEAEAEFVEEVLSTLREALFVGPRAKLASYAGRGPLGPWLSVAAARVALNQMRIRAQRARQRPN
jgi:RNA polymerase sigma-70 factor (ECF subfamily)